MIEDRCRSCGGARSKRSTRLGHRAFAGVILLNWPQCPTRINHKGLSTFAYMRENQSCKKGANYRLRPAKSLYLGSDGIPVG